MSFYKLVQIIDESTGNRRNVFLNGPQPDMVLVDEVFTPSGTPSDILWLLQDHQNTVTDVATMASSGNSTATLVNHLEYNAFGTITSQTNSAYQPLQTYTGQIWDTASGLLYYDARWRTSSGVFLPTSCGQLWVSSVTKPGWAENLAEYFPNSLHFQAR